MITNIVRKFSRFPELEPDNYTGLKNESDLFIKQIKSDKLADKKCSLLQIRRQFAIIVTSPAWNLAEKHRAGRPISDLRPRSENRLNPV